MGLAERLSRCFLPAVTLSCLIGAYVLRITRAAIISILSRPYIEMAELKGASRTAIVLRHALVNAVGPIANVVALALAYMVYAFGFNLAYDRMFPIAAAQPSNP